MSEMKIDLRMIRDWVQKWQKNNGANKTASQTAAVMLAAVLEQSEKRLSKAEAVMSGLLDESRALEKVERELVARLRSRRGLDSRMEGELKAHHRRVAVLVREADELIKAPRVEQSVRVGGLLFAIRGSAPLAVRPLAQSARPRA